MALIPQPFVEHPNLRAPIALIVDDPAPCINPLWYFRHQVDGQAEPVYPRTIPLSFMEDWCRWVSESGVRGDFTILPYPAGLGRIDQSLDGFDTGELRAWLDLAREAVAPRFDIHCEILTHTNALDLRTGRLLSVSEHEWTEVQEEETLAGYFAAAMQIFGRGGAAQPRPDPALLLPRRRGFVRPRPAGGGEAGQRARRHAQLPAHGFSCPGRPAAHNSSGRGGRRGGGQRLVRDRRRDMEHPGAGRA